MAQGLTAARLVCGKKQDEKEKEAAEEQEGKGGEAVEPAAAPEAPMMYFFQPVTLEQLVNTVTSPSM